MTVARDSHVHINPLLLARRSPYVLDAERAVRSDDVAALLEAARWSASAFNEQPWRFVIGNKSSDPEVWKKLHAALVPGNQHWAANAPVLILALMKTHFSHNEQPNGTAMYDLGAAAASLTLEATGRGLVVHQMAGIDAAKAHSSFEIAEGFQAVTALAIGYPGDVSTADDELATRDAKPRTRKPVSDLIIQGRF